MVDPVTALTASKILELAFTKLLESSVGEIGKKFTETAWKRIDDLRQAIVDRLRGRSPKVDEALTKLEQGDKSGLETIAKNLDVVMDEHPEFANEIRAIAQEINAGKLQDNSSMTQNVYDNATGIQAKAEQGGTQYIGTNQYFGTQP